MAASSLTFNEEIETWPHHLVEGRRSREFSFHLVVDLSGGYFFFPSSLDCVIEKVPNHGKR